MNSPFAPQEQYEVFPSPLFDPFPEPQTMPKGWDLSELPPASSLPAAREADTPAES